MGSVAVSDADESSELVSRLELRRYRLSKRELAVYRRAMAPGEPTEVRTHLELGIRSQISGIVARWRRKMLGRCLLLPIGAKTNSNTPC